jgi:hypothetical protein
VPRSTIVSKVQYVPREASKRYHVSLLEMAKDQLQQATLAPPGTAYLRTYHVRHQKLGDTLLHARLIHSRTYVAAGEGRAVVHKAVAHVP